MTARPRVLLSCGEASGDVYLGRLARALRERRPDLHLVGVVGPHGRAAGVEPWGDIDELAVMGFVEVVRHLPRIARFGRRIEERAVREAVSLFVPVDYPGFHVRLARRLARRGIPTLDFIPPKTWSWGRWRLRSLREAVEQCAVIFPFEEEHYRAAGVSATFVGHPLVDLHHGRLHADVHRDGILFAPGSRRQELARLVPVLVDTLAQLRATLGEDVPVRVSRAPGVDLSWLGSLGDGSVGVELVEGPLLAELQRARVAVVCSGTATMEAALSRTPHVIVYRTGRLTYAIARRLASVQHIGMANIVLGRRAFPEFLQENLRAQPIAEEVGALFLSPEGSSAQAQRAASEELEQRLGGPGCFDRVAELVIARLLRGPSAPPPVVSGED